MMPMLEQQDNIETALVKTKGERYEAVAFQFCKAATILLLTLPLRQFALPVVAAIAAVLYLLAHAHGQRGTRCILGKPLVVAAFWGAISISWLVFLLRPLLSR